MTPFSIGMFQQLDIHPKADPTRDPILTPVVSIRPQVIWDSLDKYNDFTFGDHRYAMNQYAIVSRAQRLPKEYHPLSKDEKTRCVARILEIRAKDAQNVYVRVYWLYRPEEIPTGRQLYHGKAEYIATNHMEIVDATRFIRPAQIIHVNNEVLWLQQAQLACYWRQTYDYMLQKLSIQGQDCCLSTPTMSPLESSDDKGATGAAKFVTSTVGNTAGGLGRTVGGLVGAGGRGLGQTITGAAGSAGKPVGEAIESLGNGVENGANNVSKGVEDAGKWK
ncbi:MAG: hypothetical protein Q9174_003078 [Haloplaca sp. 1 TL-2023]